MGFACKYNSYFIYLNVQIIVKTRGNCLQEREALGINTFSQEHHRHLLDANSLLTAVAKIIPKMSFLDCTDLATTKLLNTM